MVYRTDDLWDDSREFGEENASTAQNSSPLYTCRSLYERDWIPWGTQDEPCVDGRSKSWRGPVKSQTHLRTISEWFLKIKTQINITKCNPGTILGPARAGCQCTF